MQRGLQLGQMLHEAADAAFVVEIIATAITTLVGKDDLDAGVQERQLAQATGQDVVVEFHVVVESDGRRPEAHRGAALGGGFQLGQRGHGGAVAELLLVVEAVLEHIHHQLLRQRVDHADADAVQAAGNLVAVVVELAACVQDRHHHFGSGHFATKLGAHLLVLAGRNAAAVVGHGDRAIGVDGHCNVVGVAGQRLVDRVVDHLEHHVVQTGTVMHVTDVHAGTLADSLQAFQGRNAVGVVVAVVCRGVLFVAHCACRRLRRSATAWSGVPRMKGFQPELYQPGSSGPGVPTMAQPRSVHVPRGTGQYGSAPAALPGFRWQ